MSYPPPLVPGVLPQAPSDAFGTSPAMPTMPATPAPPMPPPAAVAPVPNAPAMMGFCSGGTQAGTAPVPPPAAVAPVPNASAMMMGFCSGGTQQGTISSTAPAPPPVQLPQLPVGAVHSGAAPPIAPAACMKCHEGSMSSGVATTASGITMISGYCGDKPAAAPSASSAPGLGIQDVQSLAMEWAAKLREANAAAAAAAPPPPPPTVAMTTPVMNTAAAYAQAAGQAQQAAIAEARAEARAKQDAAARAEADEGAARIDAAMNGLNKRQEMAERFASRSSLGGPAISAPKMFKKEEKPEEELPGYEDDAGAPGACNGGGGDASSSGAAAEAAEPAGGGMGLAALESGGAADDAKPKMSQTVPPASAWPPNLKAWVGRCFSLCTTSLERTSMQRQVKDAVEAAAEVGELYTRSWETEPIPSRDARNDRKRFQLGDNLAATGTTRDRSQYDRGGDFDSVRERDRDRGRDRERDRDRRDRDYRRDDYDRRDRDRRDDYSDRRRRDDDYDRRDRDRDRDRRRY